MHAYKLMVMQSYIGEFLSKNIFGVFMNCLKIWIPKTFCLSSKVPKILYVPAQYMLCYGLKLCEKTIETMCVPSMYVFITETTISVTAFVYSPSLCVYVSFSDTINLVHMMLILYE